MSIIIKMLQAANIHQIGMNTYNFLPSGKIPTFDLHRTVSIFNLINHSRIYKSKTNFLSGYLTYNPCLYLSIFYTEHKNKVNIIRNTVCRLFFVLTQRGNFISISNISVRSGLRKYLTIPASIHQGFYRAESDLN